MYIVVVRIEIVASYFIKITLSLYKNRFEYLTNN